MKTLNKTILAAIATSAILALTIGNSFAMYGNGQGQGNKQGNSSNSGVQSQSHNPSDLISNIEMQDLDATEIDLLQKQYEEETMANELYTYFYEKYGVQTFANIASSEAQHQAAIQALFDRYELEIPTSYEHIQSLYDELKAKGDLSLKDAIEVGISIEIVDIEDIVTAIKSTDNNDIKTVLVNIGGASYNHLRGFITALENNGFETDIDYSEYLTDEDLASKGGVLKAKLAEKLEAEGVELPETASSSYIDENCQNTGTGTQNYGRQNSSNMSKGVQGTSQSINNSLLKNQYKNTFSKKYSNAFQKVSNSNLENIISRIDSAILKINTGNYSNATKEKYNAMLNGLREVVEEAIND